MTDPFSIAVGIGGVFTLFKETFLIANFIYNTINSAKNYDEEREAIAASMRWELLVLQSFGRIFQRVNGTVIDDGDIDQCWLEEVSDTLERLRLDFGDYARLASRDDVEYQKYSPWNDLEPGSKIAVEFGLNRDLPNVAEPSLLSAFSRLWEGNKTKVADIRHASKWALWDKSRLEKVVKRFGKRNAKLKDLLQMAVASQQLGASHVFPSNLVATSEDAKRLDLTPHAELRQIIAQPDSDQRDFMLPNATLHSDEESLNLHAGTCTASAARGNTVSENVLIEYKSYSAVLRGITDDEYAEIHSNLQARVHQLASLLYSSGSHQLRTLPFKGIVDQPDQLRHAFVFYYPTDAASSPPQSLHAVIDSQSQGSSGKLWPLSARFHLAHCIAQSIGSFHRDGWVHKSIRSQSIMFFPERGGDSLLLESPYLVDFEYARPESGSSLRLRDNDDEKNYYRHPEIQDVARSSFSKMHDLYSLGVVLLEIALWQTARRIHERTGFKPGQLNATGLQKMYIHKATRKVGHLMGLSYQAAVLTCLDSRYKDQTRRPDFPRIFDEGVVQKLTIKAIQ